MTDTSNQNTTSNTTTAQSLDSLNFNFGSAGTVSIPNTKPSELHNLNSLSFPKEEFSAPQATIPAPQVTIPAPQVTIPTPQVTIPTPQIITKKGSKVSPLGFALGCGVFGVLILGLISSLLYFAIQNPDQFKGILSIEDIKVGLKLFVGLFFGILFFSGFGIGIFNLYKLITTKVGSKIGYIFGIIISLVFLIGSAVGGTVTFNKINEIISTTGANSSLLVPMIAFKDKMRPISEGFPIIAPTSVYYSMNPELLKRFIATNFTNKRLNSLILSCGNESSQQLEYDATNSSFIESCLYTKKGLFNIDLLATSTDKATNTQQEETISLGSLSVISELTLTPSQGPITYNDAKDEMIIGKAPTKLTINSAKVFEDLKLSNYAIKIDFDNDGTFDSIDDTSVTHQFRVPQLQSVAYQLPDVMGFGDLVYLMSFRVQQNDVPICTLTATPDTKPTQYAISASFDDLGTSIVSYLYKVKDISNNKITTLSNNNKADISYEFPKKGSYSISLEYATDEGKRGYCETDTLNVGNSDFTPRYTINFRGSNDTKWNSVLQSGSVSFKDNNLYISSLPMRIQLVINDITPQTKQTTVKVEHNSKAVLSADNTTYEVTITNPEEQSITINIKDPSLGAESTLTLPIFVVQQEVIGNMKAFPDTVGVSPYKVVLDASTTTLTDKNDEIIYFSWDFGDGKKNPNTSQGRVEHTYVYDEKLQSGTYKPSVTITTKKGKKSTLSLKDPILVKKPAIEAKISIDSHPAQVAKVGDQVSFTLQTDGQPTLIRRDFGNGNPIECNDRSCASVPTLFDKAGKYEIKASISYADLSTSTAATTLIVE